MALEIKSGATSDVLTVDITSKAARVTQYDATGNAICKVEGSSANSTALLPVAGVCGTAVRALKTTPFGNLRSQDSTLFSPPIEGATLNSVSWTSTVATMTTTQATGQITMNANNTLTTTTSAVLTSVRQIPLSARSAAAIRFRARLDWQPSSVCEIGFGAFTGTTAVTPNSIHFRITAAGILEAVITVNSIENNVQLGATSYNATGVWSGAGGFFFNWDILTDDDGVEFVVSNGNVAGDVARLRVPLANASAWISALTRLPVAARIYNSGAVGTAPHIYIAGVTCALVETDAGRDCETIQAGRDLGGVMSPTAFTQLTNFANNTVPATATLSNTAAGYTTPDGGFLFVAPGGAETDFALFAFTVPAGYNLVVRGVRIDTGVTGAASATTPTRLDWFVSDSAAVTLAANTNRKGVGGQSIPVGTAIGAFTTPIDKRFEVPFVVRGGRVFHLAVRIPVGTATAAETIRGLAVVDFYFELPEQPQRNKSPWNTYKSALGREAARSSSRTQRMGKSLPTVTKCTDASGIKPCSYSSPSLQRSKTCAPG